MAAHHPARRLARRRVELVSLSPLESLRAGRLPWRLTQLLVGLSIFGVSMALILRAGLGLEPWGVFTYGLTLHLPLSYGAMIIASSFVILLLWIPLKQWPGVGTIANAIVVGLSTDAALHVIPPVEGLGWRVVALAVGIVLNGFATALYIGTSLGPGPRDGLMTGIARVSGRSIRLVRTSIEVTVVSLGWLLGGTVGVGTLAFALAIGPLVQFFLPMTTVRLSRPEARGLAVDGDGEREHRLGSREA